MLQHAVDEQTKDAVFAAAEGEELGGGVLVVGVAEGGLERPDGGADAEVGRGEGDRFPEEAAGGGACEG